LPEKQVEASEEGASSDQQDQICILDAVICIHFAGANLTRLLVSVLKQASLTLLVPQEVCDEVARKDRKYSGLRLRWTRLEQSDHIRVLPAIEARTAPTRVVEVFTDVRGRQFEDALRDSKDLGEAVVVAHGVHYQDLGHEVYVAIDDQGGQALAAERDLQIITVEDVLTMATEFGHFRNEGELKKTYAKLRSFGDGLPPYAGTVLSTSYKEWRAQQDQV
jgi:hypothetical protein